MHSDWTILKFQIPSRNGDYLLLQNKGIFSGTATLLTCFLNKIFLKSSNLSKLFLS